MTVTIVVGKVLVLVLLIVGMYFLVKAIREYEVFQKLRDSLDELDRQKLLEQHKKSFLQKMLDRLDEKLIDAGSAISGSGPAFVYLFIEALADGAVACGIPRAKALEYAAATVIGAGELVLSSGQHPGQLKDAVCSPGGSTIAGIRALENHGFRAAAMEAVISTYNRNKELGK